MKSQKIKMHQTIDMVSGSMGDKIIRFALPLAATGMLQQLFNAADVAVVGRFVGKNAMAAVGSNSSIIGLLVNLFIGISLGANVVVSRYTGGRNKEGIRRAVHTAVLVAVLSGLAAALVGELMAAPVLHFMGVPEEVYTMALQYLRIYLAGMPVILLYNFEAAIFRSQGDTRTPLICLFTSGIINVVLNLFFVLGAGMAADGVALATVISNLISSGLMFVILLRTDEDIRIRWSAFRISIPDLKEMLRIGVPAGLQGMVFSVSNMMIQSAVNSLGADIMAASSAAFNVEIMTYYILNSFGQACTTFTGQNYGAVKPERCRRVLKLCLLQGLSATMLISGSLILLRRPLLGLFNADPVVIKYGQIRLVTISFAQILNAFNEILSGNLRGYGHSLGPAVITLLGICGTRITWVMTVFAKYRSFQMLIAAYPLSWAVTALIMTGFYFRIQGKLWNLPKQQI